MATMENLPPEVLEKYIFPHLEFNDLLRVRRVSKRLKFFTDGYVWKDPNKVGEMEISEDTVKNLAALMASGIVPSKLYVKNVSGHRFYEDFDVEDLANFVRDVAPFITNLRVFEVSVYPCFKEWTFLSSLVNLEVFQASYYGNSGDLELNIGQAQQDDRLELQGSMLPAQWTATLRKLKIGHNPHYRMTFDMMQRYVSILEQFVNLNKVCLPYLSFNPHGNSGFVPPAGQMVAQHTFNMQFVALGALAAHRRIRVVDFANLHHENSVEGDFLHRAASEAIFNLFDALEMSPAGIKNVDSRWFEDLNNPLFDVDFGSLVFSFVNLLPGVMNMDVPMPNLRKIDIRDTSRSSVDMFFEVVRPAWPSLTKLKLHVNSTTSSVDPLQGTATIFRFWWEDHLWDQVLDLTLSFEKGKVLPCPRSRNIVAAMPNLKRLKLVNWIGANNDVVTFWAGLPHLTEVVIDSCVNVDDNCFIGDNVGHPIFHQLQELRKLSFYGLDQMPGITDTVFSNVLANIQLTHFNISSSSPLTAVTKRGLIALRKGNFNQTIQHFPFHEWSTADMTKDEFAILEKEFRASCRV